MSLPAAGLNCYKGPELRAGSYQGLDAADRGFQIGGFFACRDLGRN
jgi:hypothetical protein